MAPRLPTAPATVRGNHNVLQQIGFWAISLFVFFFTSRVLDVTFPFLHIPLLLSYIAAFAVLASGNFFTAMKTPAAKWYAVLTVLFAAGVPFAYHKGGSFVLLIGQGIPLSSGWGRNMLLWIFIVGLTVTYAESKKMLRLCAYGTIATAIVVTLTGGVVEGDRLSMEVGKYNPNELAMVLLMGVPLVWVAAYDGGRSIIRKLLMGSGCIFMLLATAKTGSRAGLVMFCVMVLLAIRRVPLIRKLQIVVAGGLVVLGFATLLPTHLMNRYRTITDEDVEGEGSAVDSRKNRERLIQQSLEVTASHPLFGVGMGNFATYIFHKNQEENRPKEPWVGTHNTYTQLSSETGIPALIIFIVLLVQSWRSLDKLIRATRYDRRPIARDIYATACALQMSLGAFACGMFFAHMAYDLLPHMLVAFCALLSRNATIALAEAPPDAAPPASRVVVGRVAPRLIPTAV